MKTYSQEEIRFLKENYADHGIKYCAEKLGRSEISINKQRAKLKLKLNKKTRGAIISKHRLASTKAMEDFSVDATPFINVNDPIYAYLLGLIWADGSLTNSPDHQYVQFHSTFPDANDFIPIFLKTGDWRIYRRRRKNHPTWKESCDVKTHNKFLYSFFEKNDYKIKSGSAPTKILNIIPEELHNYWFRGLIDGDGHISPTRYSVTITSCFNQDWAHMLNISKILNLKYKIYEYSKNKSSFSRFYIEKQPSCKKFLEYIYSGEPFGLQRKFETFQEKYSDC